MPRKPRKRRPANRPVKQEKNTKIIVNPKWASYTMFCTNVGILGGSFDPIHNGHLMIADAVLKHFDLDQIIFMPTSSPPHKTNANILNAGHRYQMCKLAILDNPLFALSDLEVRRTGVTYTIDTLIALHIKYGKNKTFNYIIGADTLLTLENWKKIEKVLGMCEFIVVNRPGYKTEEVLDKIKEYSTKYDITMRFLEVPGLDISSSIIRDKIIAGDSVKYLMPDRVSAYINHWSVYKKPRLKNLQIIGILKNTLSSKRFKHTIGVADTASKLAKKYNVNESDTYRAALLHDCAKEIPFDDMISKCSDYNLVLDEITLFQPFLIHAHLGVEIAKDVFHEYKQDILHAIKYHTTARPKMSFLEMIIYLADYMEPGRGDSQFLNDVRYHAYNDIYKALLMCIDYSIKEVEESGRIVHPLTYDARTYYKTWQYDHILFVKDREIKARKAALREARAVERRKKTQERQKLKALEKKLQKEAEKERKALEKLGLKPKPKSPSDMNINAPKPPKGRIPNPNAPFSRPPAKPKDFDEKMRVKSTAKKPPKKFTKSTVLDQGQIPDYSIASLLGKPFNPTKDANDSTLNKNDNNDDK